MTHVSQMERNWLHQVRDFDERDLPCNTSTVAFAVAIALKFEDENARLLAAMEAMADKFGRSDPRDDVTPFDLQAEDADKGAYQ